MNRNFDISKYLDQAEEQFSGFDDYSSEISAEGDMVSAYSGEYEDEFYESANGGGVAMAGSPNPYSLTIVNSTAGTLTARIFGYNRFQQSTNFGSDVGLVLTPQAGISYIELISQVAEQPYATQTIRLQSTNSSQVQQVLTVSKRDAAGETYTKPIYSQNYISPYQEQSGTVDIPYAVTVDGNTTIEVDILASATLTITFFPADKVKISEQLRGKSAVKVYGRPRMATGVPVVQPLGRPRLR